MDQAISNTVRDFSDETKAELQAEIGRSTEAAKAEWESKLDKMRAACYQIQGVNFGNDFENIYKYQRDIQDVKDSALRQLDVVFREVNKVDADYSIKFRNIAEQLESYKKTLTELADIIKPGGAYGETPFTSPDFIKGLSAIGLGTVDYFLDQLKPKPPDSDKPTEYNWDMIEEWLKTDPRELSSTQLTALALTYLDMGDPNDVGRFIGAGYYFTDNPHTGAAVYKQTDTMVVITQAVIETVTPQAQATVWANPAIEDESIARYVRNMMVMQVMSEVAGSIEYTHGVEYTSNRANGTAVNPVRIYQEDGVWTIQVATNLIDFHANEPLRFGMGTPVPLGSNGVYMDFPQAAWDDAGFSLHYKLNKGSLADTVFENIVKDVANIIIGTVVKTAGATAMSIGIGIVTDQVEATKVYNVSSNFLAETGTYRGLLDLGGRICYTEIGGVRLVHGLALQANEVVAKTTGFVGNSEYNVHGVSIEQLTQIVLNGKLGEGRRPLDEKELGFSEAQQIAIWDSFQNYIRDPGGVESFLKSLRDARKTLRTEIEARFGDKYDLEVAVFGISPVGTPQWPTEVLDFVIERMGSLPDTVE